MRINHLESTLERILDATSGMWYSEFDPRDFGKKEEEWDKLDADWAYEMTFERFKNYSDEEIMTPVLVNFGILKAYLTDKERSYIRKKYWDPFFVKENCLIKFGKVSPTLNNIHFLKILLKERI